MSNSWLARAAQGCSLPILIGIAAMVTPATAGELRTGGYLGAELRVFPSSPSFTEQHDATFSPSLVLEPEWTFESEDAQNRLTFVPFARWDSYDQHRTHADVREAKYLRIGDGWDVVLGFDRVFWGVTEARHLIDIINQTDGVEDVDQEDKLGQPMVNLNFVQPWGTTRLYVLPGFRERTFPDDEARLRGRLPIATNRTEYSSGAEDRHVDFAARYSHSYRGFDFGLSQFWGTGREPRLDPVLRNGSPVLAPFYDIINQTGLDAQYTTGSLQLKLELMTMSGWGDRIWATDVGLEYTFFDVFGSGSDVGALFEYLYDNRDLEEAPPTIFDSDFFFGLRYGANDRRDTQLLLGAVVDRGNLGTTSSLEFSTRLTDRLRLEIEGRGFFNIRSDDLLGGVDRDDFILARIKYFL